MKRMILPFLLMQGLAAAAQQAILIPEDVPALEAARANLGKTNIVGRKLPLAHPVTAYDGAWGNDTRGNAVWKLALQAGNATDAMLVYFDELVLPPGAALTVSDADGRQTFGPFTENPNIYSKAYALPVVPGRAVILTVVLPKTALPEFRLRISEIGCLVGKEHGAAAKGTALGFGQAKACNANVNCAEGDRFRSAQRSVARYLYPSGTSVAACSGALINNTAGDCKNYFISASHCVIDATATDMAQTVFYFDYQSPGCTTPVSDAGLGTHTVTGCVRRAFSGTPGGLNYGTDFSLLEVNPIPVSYNVFYAGWDRRPYTATTVDSGAIIHHPMGDLKKISPIDSVFVAGDPMVVTHYRTANGNGGTEPGSSGAAFFNKSQRIFAVVQSGTDCSEQRAATMGTQFKAHWDISPLPEKQLKSWLDPGSTNRQFIDGRNDCNATAVNNVPRINDGSLQIFPTPAAQDISVSRIGGYRAGSAVCTVYNVTGLLMGSYPLAAGDDTWHISLADYPAGVYVLTVSGADWQAVQRFTKL